MKKHLSLLLLAVVAVVFLAATARADEPAYAPGPEYIWRFQCDPVRASDGSTSACKVTFFFRKDLSNGTDVMQKRSGQVDVDLGDDDDEPVTAGGITATKAQILALLQAVAAAAHNPPSG